MTTRDIQLRNRRGSPSPSSASAGFWSRTISFYIRCVLASDDYVDSSIQSPLLNESMITYNPPPRPRPRLRWARPIHCLSEEFHQPPSPNNISRPSPIDRVVSRTSIRSADIRFREGKWMVSCDLEAEEDVFIQFPPLADEEDENEESESGKEEEFQASPPGWRLFSLRRTATKCGMVQEQKKEYDEDTSTIGGSPRVMTPPENDNEKEWYPL